MLDNTSMKRCLKSFEEEILNTFKATKDKVVKQKPFYGDGKAANRVVDLLDR